MRWVCLLLSLTLFTSFVHAQSSATTTVSSTQPTQVEINVTAQTAVAATQPGAKPAGNFLDVFTEHGFGRYATGKEQLTWDLVKSPAFWFENVRDLIFAIAAFIPRLIGTLIFLVVFWLVYRGIRKLAVKSMKKSDVDTSIRDMLATLLKWVIMGFGIVIACNQLGIPIVAMLTGVSIIGLAVGFAAQETLANFIAGIVIFLDKPFKVGDWIEVDGVFAEVKRVTFRSTRMLTLDGEVVIFPNTQMLNTRVSNHSTNPINRVNVPIGIAYKESIDQARAALLAIVRDDPRICRIPAPEVVVAGCGSSSIDLLLRFWIEDESIERRIGYEMTERAKNALDQAGIEIPFPHVQLVLDDKAKQQAA